MVSEKQIKAAAKAMETLALERGFVPWDEAASVALTAAEQAEPAILPDDSLSAIISNIGNEIHNLACERQNDEDLSERLSDFRTRLWAIAQQAAIEPAPVADEEEIAKLIWERFAPAHEVEWPSGNASEYRQVAKDIVGKFRP